MINLSLKKTTLKIPRWFVYRGNGKFEKLEKTPALDGESKEPFFVIEGGNGYTTGRGYSIKLIGPKGDVIGFRKSDFDRTLQYDIDVMLSLARENYGR